MKCIDKKIICELNILKNRLDSGESILQCLQSMGIPLKGDALFLSRWNQLCELMIQGKVLPAKAIGELTQQLESNNKLLELVNQKTLSPRIQAYLSMGIIFALIISAFFLFPPNLKPSYGILFISISLAICSLLAMKLLLKNFQKELIFLEWIYFLKSLSLSLQCGMTLPHALYENQPNSTTLNKWPQSIRKRINIQNIESFNETNSDIEKNYLWNLAHRVWSSISRNYQQGLSQVELMSKLCGLLEDEFKNRMVAKSEKLSFLLLIPLFALSVPAALILLFVPLVLAVSGS